MRRLVENLDPNVVMTLAIFVVVIAWVVTIWGIVLEFMK